MAFMVRKGFFTSSIKYRSWRDGRAININIMAGMIVQMVSRLCPSRKNRFVLEEKISEANP